jgi:hypothetical protein
MDFTKIWYCGAIFEFLTTVTTTVVVFILRRKHISLNLDWTVLMNSKITEFLHISGAELANYLLK